MKEEMTVARLFYLALAIGFGIVFAGIIAFVAAALHVNFWQKKQTPGGVPAAPMS